MLLVPAASPSTPVRHLGDDERRARLATRHAIAPGHRVADAEAATRAVAVLHSTEPATVYLSVHARTEGVARADVDAALYERRDLVKQLAMRRTLFVFPRDLLPAAWGSASARTAAAEAARMAKDAVRSGLAEDGEAWLADAAARVLAHVREDPDGVPAAQIREVLPEMTQAISTSPGSVWNHTRLLTLLGARADVVRGRNAGHWRISKPRWVDTAAWLGDVPAPWGVREGYAELVRRWLDRFGPGAEDDLVWWLGATKGVVRAALGDVGAVPVTLDHGATGWLLPDDLDPAPDVEPWAALLPVLDPTTMGWRERGFHLDAALAPQLFDRNGNGGTTAWWCGQAVGCWVQDPDGVVVVHLLTDPGGEARSALDREAERLTDWLAGERVGTVYPTPAMKAARAALG